MSVRVAFGRLGRPNLLSATTILPTLALSSLFFLSPYSTRTMSTFKQVSTTRPSLAGVSITGMSAWSGRPSSHSSD